MEDVASSQSSTVQPPIWNVPIDSSEQFVGRDEVLKTLHRQMQPPDADRGMAVAIIAPGGVGKTRLAAEYLHLHRADDRAVWWISAADAASVTRGLNELALRLGILSPQEAGRPVPPEATLAALVQHRPWLLVFDSAPSPELIEPFLPVPVGGSVLVTTRTATGWRDAGLRTVKLPPLEREASIAFLQRRMRHIESIFSASRLALAIGDVPQALEQAAVCIEQTRITFDDYLRKFETHWGELLRTLRPGVAHADTLAMTWELSLREMERVDPVAADLLCLCAFLGHEQVPRALLEKAAQYAPDTLSLALRNPGTVDRAFDALRRFALAQPSADGRNVALATRTAELTRQRLDGELRAGWTRVALWLCDAHLTFDPDDARTWPACADILPHTLASCRQAMQTGVELDLAVKLMNQAGQYLYKIARFADARDVLDRALVICCRLHGEGDRRVTAVANNLARVLSRIGEHAEARTLLETAIAVDEASYGPAHPHVAELLNNYGLCLFRAGDTLGARDQFGRSLAIFESREPGSAKTAPVLNNIGYALMTRGDLPDAASHFMRALAIAQSSHDHEHPDVASILYNLADVLRLQGDGLGAEANFHRGLALDLRTYGPVHPDVARHHGGLGRIHLDRAELPAARDHFQRALDIDEAAGGRHSPELVTRLNALGRACKAMGDHAEAARCFDRAAAILRRCQIPPAPGSSIEVA